MAYLLAKPPGSDKIAPDPVSIGKPEIENRYQYHSGDRTKGTWQFMRTGWSRMLDTLKGMSSYSIRF